MKKYIPTIGDVVLYGGGTTPKVVVDMIKQMFIWHSIML